MLKTIFILFLNIFILFFAYETEFSDDVIVEKISMILTKEYDNYKDKTFLEKTILQLGKPAFVDSVKIWKNNYKNLDTLQIKLHPSIEVILNISEKHLTIEENEDFRKNFVELTLLAYKNLQIYFIALKDYLKKNNIDEIDISVVDKSLTDMKYFDQKNELYKSEAEIKSNIRLYFNNKKIKYRVSFYSFAFDFFDKIRVKIIEKDMASMLKKINEQKFNPQSFDKR